MNILLISTNRSTVPMPVMPIGACMVAEACERAGHRVTLLDLMFEREPIAAVRDAVQAVRPEVVGLSVRNIDNNDMRDTVFFLGDLRRIVNIVREHSKAPVILGGAALAVMPEAILRFSEVSCAVLGDGETVFPRLLQRIAEQKPFGDVPGVAYLDHEGFNSTPCPGQGGATDCGAPDFFRWVNIAAYRSQLATASLQTKLGCAFQCVYCTYRKIEGNGHRLADPEAVAVAVERMAASGLKDIELVDSVFNAPVRHALDVCRALGRRKHGARLQSLELNPLFVNDELLDAMEGAGFVGIGITAESASDQVLLGLRKGFTAREVHAAADAVRRHRLPCAWIFLMGGPGETEETVRKTLRFAEHSLRKDDVAFFNIGIRIYPGTELESIARRQGVLTSTPGDMLKPVFYVSPDVDGAWMMNEVRKSMASHMNFINTDSIGLSILPLVHRIGYRLGVRPPLWRHTRFIRRGLRMIGMDV
jgi:radical SAM superfamily enzyme YgiQ (UPF0313 family)